MIQDSVAIVSNGINAEKTLEEIQKNGLPSKWETYGHGYLTTEKWIALLHKNILKCSLYLRKPSSHPIGSFP